jgi:hypothetical protein
MATGRRHHQIPQPGHAVTGPPLTYYLTEPPRAVAEYGLHLVAAPLRLAMPRGDGHPVMVLPGFLASDGSTRTMHRVLRRLGYRVHGWRMGRNIGPTAKVTTGLRNRLDELHYRYGRRITLVGWSLGGIFARHLTRMAPDSVRQVITLGSPFRIADHRQSRARWLYSRYAHLHVGDWQLPLEQGYGPLPVPTTSVYSRHDGIVAWQICLNEPSPHAENIAVISSHLGLGHHPATLWAIADRLAQPEGTWTRFRPPALLRPVFPMPDVVATDPGGASRPAADVA